MRVNLYSDGITLEVIDDESPLAVDVEESRAATWKRVQAEWDLVQADMQEAMNNNRIFND
ncbi:hypothetical protein SEA_MEGANTHEEKILLA_168 [Streptomyces phage MeganTheeKilla]|uniref:Uncharacterized protein n=1 Tax=Streptomyces phage MeganTheeKilla TaxID=2801897 RepID=A0A7U0GC98_9CAUD|nr:hypothetical protein SEA_MEGANTHEEKILLA_168 [Streptomyces phage MeganTheeKilla]